MSITLLSRHQINDAAWDNCVATSANRIIYGYSWYLDAVTSPTDWSWVGLVLAKEGGYRAVMPVPLRRKWGRWVVHQPLYCQVLGVFSADGVDSAPFFAATQHRFRYGSILHCQQVPTDPSLQLQTRQLSTHLLNLSQNYNAIAGSYSRDRKLNLSRAKVANWVVNDSDDPEPLIKLFQENHATGIPNGVAHWSYAVFRHLFAELQKRELTTVRYALNGTTTQAGALFVRDGSRIIYLFNAATDAGRRGNARTLLIDQVIQQHAGTPTMFDFESPEKLSIVKFYQSFGAVAEPFWEVKYNHLSWFERKAQTYLKAFASS